MASDRSHFGSKRWLAAVAAGALLSACAGHGSPRPDIPPLQGKPEFHVSRVDMLGMTPDMQSFVDRYVLTGDSKDGRAWSLAYAALDPYLLDFRYDPSLTLTASEAFRQRKGNCLTFSNLFIAMARSVGLEAWFQEIRTPPQWNAVSDTMLVSMHVNAVVRDRQKEFTVDVSRRKQEQTDKRRRLSDREAEAQFYNNQGADALVANRLAEAYAWFRLAIETDDSLPYVWSNLGVVLKRNGQVDDARRVYQTALTIDPRHSVSLNNLYVIYSEEGNVEAAEALRQRVERIRRNNPYYLDYLAQVANEEERYADAIELAKRAIRLESREYRFHYTLARAQQLAGMPAVAMASLERARELAPPSAGTLSLDTPPNRL